tara:strand:+ start:1579 stop:1764 length:186 start_codon:yes stop_codon:yes gene_type:complete
MAAPMIAGYLLKQAGKKGGKALKAYLDSVNRLPDHSAKKNLIDKFETTAAQKLKERFKKAK